MTLAPPFTGRSNRFGSGCAEPGGAIPFLMTKSQQQFIDRALEKAFGFTPDADTSAEYAKCYDALGPDWMTPKEAGLEYRYCDSLYQMGLLELRKTPIMEGFRVVGARDSFRRNGDIRMP